MIAIKCNPDIEVIRLLAALGAGFDCSSRGEIQQALNLGIEPYRIIYANPCKSRAHIKYAQKVGVTRMTFDGADELKKIKTDYPSAELILRIKIDDSSSQCPFSHKFGAPLGSVVQLLDVAKHLALNIIGVSFHIGSGASDPQLFVKAIEDARRVFDTAREIGHSMTVLDIGGGFSTHSFDDMSQILGISLDTYFPNDIEIIAEPGRFFVESVFTLACSVIGRRDVRDNDGNLVYMLTLNDGVYGNFMGSMLDGWRKEPHILQSHSTADETIRYSVWGQTLDGLDKVVDNVHMDRMIDIGDWLYFEDMGAYSICLAVAFNGFDERSDIHYVSSEPAVGALID